MTNDTLKIIEPTILLSIINTKLRDEYSSLDILCSDLDLTKNLLTNKLSSIGYEYNQEQNQFK